MKKQFIGILLFALILPSFGQESIIKNFAEPRRSTTWLNPLCLYPSTLRMINISQDPEFNVLVNDVEKVLIYTLDSATIASKNHSSWLKEYQAVGYEEYISMQGKQDIRIIGKENEYVGLIASDGQAMVFYLRGEIPFAKIPNLLQSFQNTEMLPLITDQFK